MIREQVKLIIRSFIVFVEYCEKVFTDKEMFEDFDREYLLHRFEMKLDWQTDNSLQDQFKRFYVRYMDF